MPLSMRAVHHSSLKLKGEYFTACLQQNCLDSNKNDKDKGKFLQR